MIYNLEHEFALIIRYALALMEEFADVLICQYAPALQNWKWAFAIMTEISFAEGVHLL